MTPRHERRRAYIASHHDRWVRKAGKWEIEHPRPPRRTFPGMVFTGYRQVSAVGHVLTRPIFSRISR